MADTMDFRDIIRQKPYLLWWVRDYDALNEEAVVEAVLNNGDWEELQDLIKILGRDQVAGIFFKQMGYPRCNYSDKRANFFKNYFSEYARGNTH